SAQGLKSPPVQPAASQTPANSDLPPVCIIVENLPVPLDGRVWREARALRDAGYPISVICPKGETSFRKSYEVLEGIHIYRHPRWEASNPVGYLLEYAWALTAEFYLAIKVFTRTRFRILQGCNPPDNIFLIALFFKLFGVRFIFDHHDLSPELFQTKFGKAKGLLYKLSCIAEHLSFKVASASLATNESLKEVAVMRGKMRKDRVFVVRNCPDLNRFRRGPGIPEIKGGKRLLVAYVGFMGVQDGLPLLLESIEHVVCRQNRQDTHFLLIGDGTVLTELKAAVTEKHLSRFVTFTGQITHEQVAEYLSTADIGVAPDPKTPMNDRSTMIKLMEYMAFGLPIVLYDLTEGRRTVGSAGLYANPNDPIDFAHKLTSLLDSAALRCELGTYGRQEVEARLNWDIEKAALLSAYKTALARI